MGTLVLINDVHTKLDRTQLLYADVEADDVGKDQAKAIADYINKNLNPPDEIISSSALNLRLLIHKIRIGSSNKYLTENKVYYCKELCERSFGILSATKLLLNNDIFRHSRILPEHGESVAQCRDRVMEYIRKYCLSRIDKNVMCISHPFTCQIVSNVLLHRNHCLISTFWQKKGSGIVWTFERGNYGLKWKYVKSFNGVDCREYSEEEVHCPVFEG